MENMLVRKQNKEADWFFLSGNELRTQCMFYDVHNLFISLFQLSSSSIEILWLYT